MDTTDNQAQISKKVLTRGCEAVVWAWLGILIPSYFSDRSPLIYQSLYGPSERSDLHACITMGAHSKVAGPFELGFWEMFELLVSKLGPHGLFVQIAQYCKDAQRQLPLRPNYFRVMFLGP